MGKNVATNENELERMFAGQVTQMLDEITDNIMNKLLQDFQKHLDKTVYSPRPDTGANNPYKRLKKNGGFYSGWIIKENQKSALKGIVKSMVFDGSLLTPPSYNNGLAHGGATGRDQRGKMTWILNDFLANDYYSYFEGAYYLRKESGNSVGYWDSYLPGLEKKMNGWINAELKKYGINRR